MSRLPRQVRRVAGLFVVSIAASAIVSIGAPAPPAMSAPEPVDGAEQQLRRAGAGRLGTNVGAVDYYGGTVPFNDLVQQASDWIPQRDGGDWGSGEPVVLRSDGWPARLRTGQYATAVLADVTYPAGVYRVSWRGNGRFEIDDTEFVARGPGKGAVTLDGSSMVLLHVRATDPDDPLRRVKVRIPGATRGDVFRTGYLRQLRIYRVLRFMDWQRTNSVPWADARVFDCADRVRPGSFSQGTVHGVSVERMVDLANAVDAHPWFTIPEEATPAWIRCHAQVVVERLEPGLVPRYEFSNETWNPAFRAFHDLTEQARATDLGDGDDYLGLQRQTARRHVAAMRVVESVFRASGRRVVRVLSGQAANSWVLEQRLLTPGTRAHTDQIAIAPYIGVPGANPFDPAEAAEIATLTTAQLFERLDTAQISEVDIWIGDHLDLSRRFERDLVAYEGGQHLAGDTDNDALTDLFTGANGDPMMGEVYSRYLDRWAELTGNQLIVHFTDMGPSTRYGSWGALTSWKHRSSPKYDALREFATGG